MYEAQLDMSEIPYPHPHNWIVKRIGVAYPWETIDGLTEAEAKASAFILNALANGCTVASGWFDQDSLHMNGYREAVVYDGPTEGIGT